MSTPNAQMVKCGDTSWCNDCTLYQQNPALSEYRNSFTRNQAGCCDFYNGPNKELIKVQAVHRLAATS